MVVFQVVGWRQPPPIACQPSQTPICYCWLLRNIAAFFSPAVACRLQTAGLSQSQASLPSSGLGLSGLDVPALPGTLPLIFPCHRREKTITNEFVGKSW